MAEHARQLPVELLRIIFEWAGQTNLDKEPQIALRLQLVSRAVRLWLLPIIYFAFKVVLPSNTGEVKTTPSLDMLLHMLKAPDDEPRQHVRHIVILGPHVGGILDPLCTSLVLKDGTNLRDAPPWIVHSVALETQHTELFIASLNIVPSAIFSLSQSPTIFSIAWLCGRMESSGLLPRHAVLAQPSQHEAVSREYRARVLRKHLEIEEEYSVFEHISRSTRLIVAGQSAGLSTEEHRRIRVRFQLEVGLEQDNEVAPEAERVLAGRLVEELVAHLAASARLELVLEVPHTSPVASPGPAQSTAKEISVQRTSQLNIFHEVLREAVERDGSSMRERVSIVYRPVRDMPTSCSAYLRNIRRGVTYWSRGIEL